MSKNWIPAPQIFGRPLGIIDVAYINGMYLANPSEHPEGTESFQTNIISTDFEHWQNRVVSPKRDYQIDDVRFFSTDEAIYAIGSKITETSKKLLILSSNNGIDWNDYFETSDESDKYKCIDINHVAGLHIISCIGCIFVSSDNFKTWNRVDLPEQYKTAIVSGSAVNSNGIHLLVRTPERCYLAIHKSGNQFDITPTPWLMESVSITSNNQQILVTGIIKNHAFIVFFVDDPEAYEILSLPERTDNPEHLQFISISDMQWIDNQWFFAVSQEFYTVSKDIFSNGGFVYRIEGELTVDSKLIKDNITARKILKIRKVNDKIVAFGNAHPMADGCFFVLESE